MLPATMLMRNPKHLPPTPAGRMMPHTLGVAGPGPKRYCSVSRNSRASSPHCASFARVCTCHSAPATSRAKPVSSMPIPPYGCSPSTARPSDCAAWILYGCSAQRTG
eukprot:5992241-Alexandrium_andersonii.AAC.1